MAWFYFFRHQLYLVKLKGLGMHAKEIHEQCYTKKIYKSAVEWFPLSYFLSSHYRAVG